MTITSQLKDKTQPHDLIAGMHRKSLEAAEQLKDDTSCASDKEDHNETDRSDASTNNSTTMNKSHNAQETNNNGNTAGRKDSPGPCQQASPGYDSPFDRGANHPGNERVQPTDPEEFRNNSIACLRAKAQEHQAKLLGFSTDALMLVSPQRRPCDANANSLHTLQHPENLNSSDNSSSIF